jgi:hypothetical protein
MTTFRGALTTGESKEPFELAFDDGEIVALKVYSADVDKCLQRSFLGSPGNFHLSLKFTSLDSTHPEASVETGTFNEEQWAAFLHLFRPLAGLNNDKEMYGFLRVRKLIERRATSSARLCGFLNQLLADFQTKGLPFEMTLGIDGEQYDLEGVFGLWMNAMEFHRDADKRAVLNKMSRFLPENGIRTLMANLALEKLRAMARLRHFISLLFAPPGTEAPLSPRPTP